jgi:hypothetical protein
MMSRDSIRRIRAAVLSELTGRARKEESDQNEDGGLRMAAISANAGCD